MGGMQQKKQGATCGGGQWQKLDGSWSVVSSKEKSAGHYAAPTASEHYCLGACVKGSCIASEIAPESHRACSCACGSCVASSNPTAEAEDSFEDCEEESMEWRWQEADKEEDGDLPDTPNFPRFPFGRYVLILF